MMHYITFAVTPGAQYNYSVRSGASEGLWSAEFSFRAPGGSVTETRLATYGDMGHSRFNCMQNLIDDAAGGLIDVVVHMGDHCYNLGEADDRRGDAYMNVGGLDVSTKFPTFICLNFAGVWNGYPYPTSHFQYATAFQKEACCSKTRGT
jgi:hypothetical protein